MQVGLLIMRADLPTLGSKGADLSFPRNATH